MRESGLVEGPRLLALYTAIEPQLYRFPAIDPRRFRRRVERFVAAQRWPPA